MSPLEISVKCAMLPKAGFPTSIVLVRLRFMTTPFLDTLGMISFEGTGTLDAEDTCIA
jgi:hypothetical protein